MLLGRTGRLTPAGIRTPTKKLDEANVNYVPALTEKHTWAQYRADLDAWATSMPPDTQAVRLLLLAFAEQPVVLVK